MSTEIQETINRLRELDRQAMPSPWWVGETARWGHTVMCEHYDEVVEVVIDACREGEHIDDSNPDLQLIIQARNAIPALLAEIERLAEENLELKRENHLAWSKGHAAGWDCHIVTMQSADLLPKDQETSPYKEEK